jgi:protein SCO1
VTLVPAARDSRKGRLARAEIGALRARDALEESEAGSTRAARAPPAARCALEAGKRIARRRLPAAGRDVDRNGARAFGCFPGATLFLRRRSRPLWDNSRMIKRFSWLLVTIAALCAALAGFWLARELDSSAPQLASGTWLAQPRTVADFELTDNLGRPFTAHELQGKPSLVFFGFTHCPDVCPTTLVKLAQVKKAAAIAGLQVLFVTVDPQRDTPTAVGMYVHAFDPDFIGLTGDPKAIGKMTAAFGVAALRVDLPGGDYTMDHSAAVFLVDASARIVGIFTPPFDTRSFAQDLHVAAPHLTAHS